MQSVLSERSTRGSAVVKQAVHELMTEASESLEAATLLLKEGYADFAASRGY